MPFRDREQAASLLSQALRKYRGQNPLVLAIPRGAVPMAAHIARELQGDLDVVFVRKLGAPGHAEYAIGAIGESGEIYLNPGAARLNISREYLEAVSQEQMQLIRKRRRSYTPHREPLSPSGRVVIVVDDGIATGSTMIAALNLVRQQNPKKLVVATAVAPPDTLSRLAQHADDIVCLEAPETFYAVGQFFEDFSQVEDSEVIKILAAT